MSLVMADNVKWFKVCVPDGTSTMPLIQIKIDVEGCELEVLRGARNLISRHQPNFCRGIHTFNWNRTALFKCCD